MKRMPSNLVFQSDFYLTKDKQNEPRMGLAKKASRLGFRKFGAEFLFMHTQDLQNLSRQEKQARSIKKELEEIFDETYFSVHAPWLPVNETAFEISETAAQNVEQLLNWCADFVDVVNLHATVVPLAYWKEKNPSFEQKNEWRERTAEKLADLRDSKRIAVESVWSPMDAHGMVGYAACLPNDLLKLAKAAKTGVTIDTAHSGIVIEACRQMAKEQKLFTGFFEEDWKEIQKVAKKGPTVFEKIGKKIRHLHCSDFKLGKEQSMEKAQDGKVVGEGNTPTLEWFSQVERLARIAGKKQIGATLEIMEDNYLLLPNAERMIQTLADWYGLGN
jgi:sugar phosphate isomerase/epimerase